MHRYICRGGLLGAYAGEAICTAAGTPRKYDALIFIALYVFLAFNEASMNNKFWVSEGLAL